jgi:hypothetical protein
MAARKKSKKNVQGLKISGAKKSWTGKTKSKKGTVHLYAKKGFAGIKETRTMYKTSNGQRRIFQTITYTKVIK